MDSSKSGLDSIDIDYERVDVASLMDQIKRAAAARPAPEPGPAPGPADGGTSESPVQPTAPGLPPPGLKQRLKAKVLRMMEPFFPVIRLLALPLHEEIRATQKSLHESNRRVDEIAERIEQRMDERFRDLDKSMEYIKLLHNLSHNLVVELTKLKIEADTLKSRAGILEKDLEFLQKREKALEDQALK